MSSYNILLRFALIFSVISFSTATIQSQALDYVQGEILVVLEDDTNVERFSKDLGLFEKQRTNTRVTRLKTEPIKMFSLRFDHERIHERRFLDEIRNRKEVKMAQFNHLIEYRNIPNDPRFFLQWQYINDGTQGLLGADIDMELAWDIATGGLTTNGDTIVACVIDGGMDPIHEDFGDNLWKNHAEIPDNGIDDDNNGYVDDHDGWSAYESNDEVFKGGSHGTPVAGIIGAQGNNGVGVSGVNWDVKLMIIRGGGNEAAALEAYAYPYTMRKRYNETNGEEGAFVVTTNASWGSDFLHWEDAPIWCSFYDSLGVIGILNCGATINGNYDVDEVGDMPTSCPSDYLISVTNLASNDNKVTGAGYGVETIDLGAYGAGTYTTSLNNNYGGFGGTSGATPHVAGAVALAYSVNCTLLADLAMSDPGQAALLVKEFILNGAKPNESLNGITVTGAKLNVNNTLELLQNYCGDCPYPVSVNIASSGIDMATIEWTSQVDSINFDMVYRIEGSEEWDTLFNVQSPVTLENLELCSTYYYKLRTRCDTDSGDFSFEFDFQTDGCCIIPENHEVLVEENELLIVLEDILATNTYTLEYKLFGAEDWNSITLDTNVFALQNPGDCNFYTYRYRSVCLNDTTLFSDIFSTEVDCPECTEKVMCEVGGGTFFEWIEEISIGDFINLSGADDNGYGDYSKAYAAMFYSGQDYPFTLTPGFGDQVFDEYVKVFIDTNLDGVFDDSEAVLDVFIEGGEQVIEMLQIPKNIIPGVTKMRVIMSFQEIGDPCSFLTYGEIEDYCIELFESTDCFISEIEMDTTFVGTDRATIHWVDYEGTQSYNYRYRIQNQADWINGETTDTILMLHGLDSCSVYEIQLERICSDGITGFSESFVFETDCTNAVTENGSKTLSLEVSPNPFDDFIDVRIPDDAEGPYVLSLFSADGKKILERTSYIKKLRLELEPGKSQNASIFFLKVTSKNRSMVKKLISSK